MRQPKAIGITLGGWKYPVAQYCILSWEDRNCDMEKKNIGKKYFGGTKDNYLFQHGPDVPGPVLERPL